MDDSDKKIRFCPNCDSVVETTVREATETYPVKGEDISVQAHVRYCDCCGVNLWDKKLDAQNLLYAYAEYRRRHNMMQPSEIRALREKYHLSQTAFARVLGLDDNAIARYENGSIADAASNHLMELVRQPGNFVALLEKNKEKISAQDYADALATLDNLCSLKPSSTAVRSHRAEMIYVEKLDALVQKDILPDLSCHS